MMNFPQQRPPGLFSFIEEIFGGLHPSISYVLAAIFTIGFYFYGLEHGGRVPLVVFVGLGLITGLLATALLKHLAAFLICATLVGAAGLATWWLLGNEAALRRGHNEQQDHQTVPVREGAHTSHGVLDELYQAVKP